MMRSPKNITGINTRITVLADVIQKSRVVLSSDNEQLNLSSEETRRIILICLMLIRNKKINCPCASIHLGSALVALNIENIDIFELFINDSLRTAELSGALNELSCINQYPDWPDPVSYTHLLRCRIAAPPRMSL